MKNNEWSLTKLPPEGHEDVGEFAYSLFEAALAEQERLKVRQVALDNHALYRGRTYDREGNVKKRMQTPVNLFFANVERTVSNLTAKNPTAEVIDLDGNKDRGEDIMSARLRAWWKETGQRKKHKDSVRNMEIYGYTPEKPYWSHEKQRPDVSVMDTFGVIPAPGAWRDWAVDPPYLCYLATDYVDSLEQKYGVEGIAADETYSLMGEGREKHGTQSIASGSRPGTVNAVGNYADRMHPVTGKGHTKAKQFDKGLVVEVWLRGASGTITKDTPILDEAGQQRVDVDGGLLYERVKFDKYPDGIRKITISRADYTKTKKQTHRSAVVVLDDVPNPNINSKLDVEISRKTYPWGRFPIYKADSYRDAVSSYGFSAAEQVGDLLIKIEEIFTRLFAYARQALSPTLIVEKYCGITREMIEMHAAQPRLVLMPTKPGADIRYLETPNLPSTFFEVLNLFTNFFDRIYQIEDADRGVSPKGIIAASAIVALQERNAVLMQSKIDSADTLCSERGMWAIGLWQNFGTKSEEIDINGSQDVFIGVDYANRRFSYAVEAGSTTPKTSMQVEEQVKWLAEMKMIDLRTILETINFPNWKNIVERNGEGQLDMALSVLVEAGLDEDQSKQLKAHLIQPQGGPGDPTTGPVSAPKAKQGERPTV